MISVGIDVSKGKSTICILKPYGEIIKGPFEVQHTNSGLENLVQIFDGLDEEFRVAMEATGAYHYPILYYLKEKGYFVTLVNPLEMKRYRCQGLRNPKTDRIDARIIATYVLDYWNSIKDYTVSDESYAELRFLTRQYRKYMDFRVGAMTTLTDILDMTMPGIRTVLTDWNKYSNKDPLSDFTYDFWHYDNVKKYSKEEFVEEYVKWAKEKGFRRSETKAIAIYELAHEEIPTLPSSTPSTKMLVQEAVKLIHENDTVYITGGSFGYIMASSMLPRDIHYTVVVNSVDIAKILRDFDNIDVYITGGKMRQSGSVVDSLATEFVSRLHFDTCFLTGAGLTADFGLSNGTDETAAYQRAILKNSRKKYLLIPGSKIGTNAFIKVCEAELFDCVITDWDCIEEQVTAIEEKGVKVIIVEDTK